jgi:nitroreductase
MSIFIVHSDVIEKIRRSKEYLYNLHQLGRKRSVIFLNYILEIIEKRRSIRKYHPTQIKDEELTAILEAGRSAPSGGNNQTSHFVVIQNASILQELKQLVSLEFQKMELKEGMYKSLEAAIKAAKKGGYDFFYNAPTLVVAANQKKYGNAIADCACALENMMLAASSLNIGSCWINQLHWLDDNEVIHKYMVELGLGDDETICGGLSLGYSAMNELSHLSRTGNNITYIK